MYETLDLQVEERVANLTLNRPDVLNAINEKMLTELRSAFEELDEREDVCVVVLRGAGRAFCAGMDLKWLDSLTKKDLVENNRLGQKIFERIEATSTPVFAAVHGYCLGGGFELALAADFIVGSSNAQVGLPEITLSARPPYRPKAAGDDDAGQPEFGGIVPGWGSVRRLPELIGKARAKELFLTGVRVDAERALQLGILNDVYPEEEFEEQVTELANRIGAMNRYNLRLVNELVTKGYDMPEAHPA